MPQPLDHHQVLEIITAYHDMLSREKQMHSEHENGLKPHFSPFLALIRPILGPTKFVSATRPPTGTEDHYCLSQYEKSGKTNAFRA